MPRSFVPELRNALLLLASLFFYAWGEVPYAAVMLVAIAVNYVFGLAIEAARGASPTKRVAVITAAVAFDLLLLAYFKYFGFACENWNALRLWLGLAPVEVQAPSLPLGISFFTFHCLSYLIDVHRGTATAQRSVFDFGLYIAFFPQLIAGPIVRYHEIAGQIRRRVVSANGFALGIERFVTGLAKKMLLANPLGLVADRIFAISPEILPAGVAWLGLACYTLQIYLDFSAYSDMAIGLARMFGFRFPENFDYPYTARSIQEFWRRWHMSLSRWFRDYLYIPLGGNRVSEPRVYRNLAIVFLLCGLWHGANWTFVAWGALHGALLIVERGRFGRWLERWPGAARRAYVLGMVMLAWILFRCETIERALAYGFALAGGGRGDGAHTVALYLDTTTLLTLALAVPTSLGAMSRFPADQVERTAAARASFPAAVRLAAVLVLLVLSASQLAMGTYNPFIYFRF